jgi:hypothetical protein
MSIPPYIHEWGSRVTMCCVSCIHKDTGNPIIGLQGDPEDHIVVVLICLVLKVDEDLELPTLAKSSFWDELGMMGLVLLPRGYPRPMTCSP